MLVELAIKIARKALVAVKTLFEWIIGLVLLFAMIFSTMVAVFAMLPWLPIMVAAYVTQSDALRLIGTGLATVTYVLILIVLLALGLIFFVIPGGRETFELGLFLARSQ